MRPERAWRPTGSRTAHSRGSRGTSLRTKPHLPRRSNLRRVTMGEERGGSEGETARSRPASAATLRWSHEGENWHSIRQFRGNKKIVVSLREYHRDCAEVRLSRIRRPPRTSEAALGRGLSPTLRSDLPRFAAGIIDRKRFARPPLPMLADSCSAQARPIGKRCQETGLACPAPRSSTKYHRVSQFSPFKNLAMLAAAYPFKEPGYPNTR